ncbi:MAG: Helicase associated domain protein [Schwartzia sp.]|nr:Helicase associated domain protein [Schwartzia sp. (in: firmicutes)]
MKISLFPHNQSAYDSAVAMLAGTGKAAVVHPTGTGKSFIAFKLCEDNPKARALWLSPSEYIFRTQVENLARTGAEPPGNISFLTYAKLMLLSPEEIEALQPGCIILDEFHRCGAEYWGRGVQRLLAAYPGAPVLGLSATSIRYLDNRRDMADELFDGCVASEMTLGEAVVRGILAPPTYVLSAFSCERDIRHYETKIRKAKNPAIRRSAEEKLQAIRRAVAQADGLDLIFKKHIKDTSGKYILFVPNAESMKTVKEHCPAWFRDIDNAPHIYTAYSDDPETSKAFAEFKADKSGRLKVLIAINMLNEGIHVEDISGVILFRPTISPIIYKQQIGRALSASGTKRPLILDIVANICNLCSIDSLRDEITETLRIFRERGDGDKIAVDGFQILDETMDCRKLFDELDKILSSSWEEMYQRLRAYKRQHGHANVPAAYKTPDGLSLGNWCVVQRRIYRGTSAGLLTEARIRKLEDIGFQWEPLEERWRQGYAYASEYLKRNHHLDVPALYKTDDGFPLGTWIRDNRAAFRKRKLSEEKIRRLQEIQMIWDVDEYRWMRNYALCRAYVRKHNKQVPYGYVTSDGVRLGKWLSKVRTNHVNKAERYRALRDDQIELLAEIGVKLEKGGGRSWERSFAAAEQYFRENGNLDIPEGTASPDGVRLRRWLDCQRQSYAGLNHGSVTPERKAKLDALHFDWSLRKREDTWPAYFQSVEAYARAHKGKLPPRSYVDGQGLRLGAWLGNQREKYRKGKLPKEREALLRGVGAKLDGGANEARWWDGYRKAMECKRLFPTMKIPALYRTKDGYPIGEWLRTQVRTEAVGKLKEERKELLDGLGVPWKSTAENSAMGMDMTHA